MARKLPETELPELVPHDGGRIRQTRHYKLITPLFGGGVEVQQADPISVVRASEVRGQLRFWWRATRGGQFGGDWTKMKAAEDLLWGSTEQQSLVQVSISDATSGQAIEPFAVEENPNRRGSFRPRYLRESQIPAYIAFPLQPSRDDLKNWAQEPKQLKAVLGGVTFALHLTYPHTWPSDVASIFPKGNPLDQELEAALWAWETFGGLGGRTRRGFGTIVREDSTDLPCRDVRTTIHQQLEQYVVEGTWPKEVPHLRRDTVWCRIIYKDRANFAGWNHSSGAWEWLVSKLSDFRQRRDPPDQAAHPGQSHWPEPDVIRRATTGNRSHHDPQRIPIEKLPRAVFGLPIVTQFKDAGKGDPNPSLIRGRKEERDGTKVDYDRLGSPLIIRPLRCEANGKKVFVAIAVVLEMPLTPPGGLALGYEGEVLPLPNTETELTTEDVAILDSFPTKRGDKPRFAGATRTDGTIDVLRAFLNFAEETIR